jgi:hypothetical protein
MASAPAASARSRYCRTSLWAKRIVGTKCVRVLPLRRWTSSMPPAGGTRSSISTTLGRMKQRLLEGTVGADHELDVDALVLEELDHRAGHRAAGGRDQRFHLSGQSDHFTAGRPLVRKHYARDDVNRNA